MTMAITVRQRDGVITHAKDWASYRAHFSQIMRRQCAECLGLGTVEILDGGAWGTLTWRTAPCPACWGSGHMSIAGRPGGGA